MATMRVYPAAVKALLFIAAASVIPVHGASNAQPPARQQEAQEKTVQEQAVIGALEYVALDNIDVVVKARIDTGAGQASIDAEIIRIKKGDNANPDRVIFNIVDKNGNKKTLERKVVEWVNIKKKGDAGFIKRPVIKMIFCLGGKKVAGRINLADRSGFLYPMLVGRNILKAGNFLVDADKKYTHEPDCK